VDEEEEEEEEEDEESLSDFRCVALWPAAAAGLCIRASVAAPAPAGALCLPICASRRRCCCCCCQHPANPCRCPRLCFYPLPAAGWTARLRHLLSWRQTRAGTCRRAAGRPTSAYTESLTA
jgi:hypothetical protein